MWSLNVHNDGCSCFQPAGSEWVNEWMNIWQLFLKDLEHRPTCPLFRVHSSHTQFESWMSPLLVNLASPGRFRWDSDDRSPWGTPDAITTTATPHYCNQGCCWRTVWSCFTMYFIEYLPNKLFLPLTLSYLIAKINVTSISFKAHNSQSTVAHENFANHTVLTQRDMLNPNLEPMKHGCALASNCTCVVLYCP